MWRIKRIINLMLFITVLFISSSLVYADTTINDGSNVVESGMCGENITWTIYDDGTIVIDGTGKMDDYDSMFPWHEYLYSEPHITSVIVKDGVESISNYAFEYFKHIESLTLPKNLKTIGYNAFRGCTGLTTICLMDGLVEIGGSAFEDCSSVESITIPSSVEWIGGNAFVGTPWYAKLLEEGDMVIINGILLNYDNDAVSSEINLPEGITAITDDVFWKETKIEKIVLPKGVKRIGNSTFEDCTNLKDITLPESLESIGAYTFRNCESLETIILPPNVDSVPSYAFRDCINLKSVILPENLKYIGYFAFQDCTSLQRILVPNSVTEIQTRAFSGCNNLEEVTFGDSLNYIGEQAFYGCNKLTSVTLPASVNIVDRYAFYNCSKLAQIILPSSISKIGDYAFSGELLTQRIYYAEHDSYAFNAIKYTYKTDNQLLHCLNKHNLNESIITEATCDKYGKVAVNCAYCDYMTFDTTPKKEHKSVTDAAVAATCTKDGLTEGSHCSVCDTVIKAQEVVKATGHKETTVTTKATTSKNGKVVTKCKTCDRTLSTKTIYKASTVKLKTTKYTYNGKVKSPSVIVKDSKGKTISSKNYTITKAKGRKNVGKYTYKITFKNQYKGTKNLTFTINPKSTNIKSLTKSKKAFTVKWGKVSKQATGYQIMYATNKKFTQGKKAVTMKSYKTNYKKISNLKAKKTYYVKIRTYKTVDGKKYYSSWSKYKTVTTK